MYRCDVISSYVWHGSFICVSWLIHLCDMTLSYMWHDSFICLTWLIHMRAMTHSFVWHDSFIHVAWLIYVQHPTETTCAWHDSSIWHDSFIFVTWLIHKVIPQNMFYLYDDATSFGVASTTQRRACKSVRPTPPRSSNMFRHDLFICSHSCQNIFSCETWLIYKTHSGMPHSNARMCDINPFIEHVLTCLIHIQGGYGE